MELKIEGVTKMYGTQNALDAFTFSFHEGIYGILGTNGAGKSTLMKLITDSITRTSGKILYDGKDILELKKSFRSLIGYMPQEVSGYGQFSGRAFLSYMAELKAVPKKDAKKQIEELLQIVNLTEVAHRKVAHYSGGMKQRLFLAQALLGDPKILLLDEPTAGMDPKERISIRKYIKNLSKNRIVLLTTHVVSDVEPIADQILLMKSGKLVKSGTVQELLDETRKSMDVHSDQKMGLEEVYLFYLEEGVEIEQ